MKKQILTLSLCLALTATSALSCGASTVTKKAPTKTHTAVSKTVKKAVKKTTPVACKKTAPAVTLTPEQLAKQKIEEKMAQERAAKYDALDLSAEQRTKAEALAQKHREGAEPLIAKIHQEKAKLHELKAKKACPVSICKQKQALKAAKKDFRKYMANSRKEFEAILTPVQVAKLHAYEATKKECFKKHHANGCQCPCCRKHHHHGVAPCDCQKSAPATTTTTPVATPAPAAK